MIDKYEIKKNDLYLYLNYDYEFGLFSKTKGLSLKSEILKFTKSINYNGRKVFLIVNGLIFCTLILTTNISKEKQNDYTKYHTITSELKLDSIKEIKNQNNQDNINLITKTEEVINNEEEITNTKEETKVNKGTTNNQTNIYNNNINKGTNSNSNQNTNTNTTDSNQEEPVLNKTIVTVYRSNGTVLNIELEEYLVGVVAAEMPASFNIEALKAQALASRTYTLKLISQGRKLTDTSSTQNYNDISELKSKWGSSFNTYYNKVKSAVESTKGQYITYNGSYIDAVYHSTSNGKTQSAINVWGNDIPYLKSVDSLYDKIASSYLKTETKDITNISSILGLDLSSESLITVNKDISDRISTIEIDGKSFKGLTFQTLLGLRSNDYDIIVNENNITITTRGYGHGVGMSQYGANGMANAGYNYKQILTHYYKGITIS